MDNPMTYYDQLIRHFIKEIEDELQSKSDIGFIPQEELNALVRQVLSLLAKSTVKKCAFYVLSLLAKSTVNRYLEY